MFFRDVVLESVSKIKSLFTFNKPVQQYHVSQHAHALFFASTLLAVLQEKRVGLEREEKERGCRRAIIMKTCNNNSITKILTLVWNISCIYSEVFLCVWGGGREGGGLVLPIRRNLNFPRDSPEHLLYPLPHFANFVPERNVRKYAIIVEQLCSL